MQWLDLLNRIPSNLHDSLALGLVTGAEVVVQQVIRMEKDFVIVRGRMAGSTAEPRVLIVPYSHMTMLAFNKSMMEQEVQEVFGRPSGILLRPSAAAPATTEEKTAAEPAPAETATPPAEMPAAAAGGPPKPKSAPPQSKSILLARLRERLAEKAK